MMEEEELAKQWEGLKLSKDEKSIYQLSTEGVKDLWSRGKHCLIGLVLTEKGINREVFTITMSQVWRLEGWVRFKEVGDHRFIIEFQWLADKEKVLSGRLWFFDRNLLTFQEVDGSVPANAV